jgi:hypothetical protein
LEKEAKGSAERGLSCSKIRAKTTAQEGRIDDHWCGWVMKSNSKKRYILFMNVLQYF